MRITLLRATAAALLIACTLAHAQQPASGPILAQRKNCMACHAVAAPLMGPSFHAIADRYLARADAVDYLAQSIVKGSVGVWGPVPMPANTQLTEDEAHTLAHWIMTLK
ncbi:c-type cytochrome [Burkholderia plantarii]|uniref:c-type cytochrome n=1 Tax=Burkholderia plantarii TaxID=41899 RepID=UPI0006D8A01B|nr:c-type cytochrome [Burkholderia plantarii]ALK31650.1 Cytochrome c, class I [Burkholderia plantarii]GLZ18074.1 cytochrome c [Burkholderia plantarii]